MRSARAVGLCGLALLAFSASGCATREECRAEDWSSIGQRDGAEGHAPSRLEPAELAASAFFDRLGARR